MKNQKTEKYVLFKQLTRCIGLITLNNPNKMNALSVAVGQEFQDCVTQISQLKELRCIIISGNGSAFSAGGDLQFLQDRLNISQSENCAEMLCFYNRFLSMRRLIKVPIIAAINGAAVGAGFVLAMTCDIRIVSLEAKLGVNFSQIGIHAGLGSTHFLPKLIGHQNASYLLLTGQLISGLRAKEMGIALDAVPLEKLMEKVLEIANNIASASPMAVQSILETLRSNLDLGLTQSLQVEANAQAQSYSHDDFKIGLKVGCQNPLSGNSHLLAT